MGYKTILVHFTNIDHAGTLLRVGLGLARSQDAHLIGLYVVPRIQYFYTIADVQTASEIFEAEEKAYRERGAYIKEIFDQETAHDDNVQWVQVNGSQPTITTNVLKNSFCVDCVVTGKGESEQGNEDLTVSERLVMESGRPILVVPAGSGEIQMPPRIVVVAWNATREASRAVFDALPILKSADCVKLLWVDVPKNDEVEHDIVDLGALATTLARHDVKIEVLKSVISLSANIEDDLLSQAIACSADMIVMGAYGHSRLSEYVFGGVTRYMLRSMTIPVLLSH